MSGLSLFYLIFIFSLKANQGTRNLIIDFLAQLLPRFQGNSEIGGQLGGKLGVGAFSVWPIMGVFTPWSFIPGLRKSTISSMRWMT